MSNRTPAQRYVFRLALAFLSGVAIMAAPQWALAQDKDEALPEWLQLDLEYRVRTRYLNPFELSGTQITETVWADQRLRTELGFVRPGLGAIKLQLDVLDDVLLGDNGTFGRDPEPSAGLSLASQWPNLSTWDVGLPAGADPLDPDSYVPVLRPADAVRVHQLYGEVYLPVGLLRVGRQPYNEGAAISAHDGARSNRWGVSTFSHTADRVLFATKLDEAFKALLGGRGAHDFSRDNGVFFIVAYDWGTQDDIASTADDLQQGLGSLQWKVARSRLFGWDWRDLVVSGSLVYRHSAAFDTDVFGIPFRVAGQVGPFTGDFQVSMLRGATGEISQGISLLTGAEPVVQDLDATGFLGRVDANFGPVELTFEVDYATGDDDPQGNNPMTVFNFARDFNVGLLLFEHILAFESARSAAVGIENLREVESTSFPLTEIETDGRFTNALALFPQVKLTLVDTPRHRFTWRSGALFAWSDVGVVDPVMTILRKDGDSIADDRVNYHGGAPGNYYGTELDQQLEWTFAELLVWTVEGAVLFPGDGLRDEHGDAVTSFFVENRFTVLF